MTDQHTHYIHDTPTEIVDIDHVTPYPGNPRVGDRALIARSLHQHGQYRPLTVQRSTGRVLLGNNTWRAAREAGWQRIAVQYLDIDDDQAARILLLDNKANDRSSYDRELLLDRITELPDLDGTGYVPDEIDTLHEILQSAPDPLAETDPQHDSPDDTERWPTITARVPQETYRRWLRLDGTDDHQRIQDALQRCGL